MPGVGFRPVSFVPTWDKHAGKRCRGVEIVVTDRNRFRPFRTGIACRITSYNVCYTKLLRVAALPNAAQKGSTSGWTRSCAIPPWKIFMPPAGSTISPILPAQIPLSERRRITSSALCGRQARISVPSLIDV